ncbi:hypothetical protein BGX27_003697 [Mortierella sp. AM989]|nr:hypothetical protein BGX27_003697 [Mortierella sp. AM989]
MTKKSVSGTDAIVEHRLPAIPSSVARSKSHRLPSLPPQPPPHDDDYSTSLQDLHDVDQPLEKHYTMPPPPPPSKSFYNTVKFSRSKNASPTFLEGFMVRHPRISRHRRRFAALICTIVTLVLLLIVLLAIVLSQKGSNNYESGGTDQGGGGIDIGGGGGGDYGDGPSATDAELQKHNQGISRPPINNSNAPGWTREGKGNATFYDPTVKNGAGTFQQGACEYEYINSVHDMVAALNKPDIGSFPITSHSPACGQCLQVTGPNGIIQVQIVDMCPGCKSGSLDLTPGAFAKIADLDKGRVPISWQQCP